MDHERKYKEELDLVWHAQEASLGSREHNLPHNSPIWGCYTVSNVVISVSLQLTLLGRSDITINISLG